MHFVLMPLTFIFFPSNLLAVLVLSAWEDDFALAVFDFCFVRHQFPFADVEGLIDVFKFAGAVLRDFRCCFNHWGRLN